MASDYEKRFYIARQKEFALQDNLLYLQVTPTNSQDMAPVFVVPTADRQAAIEGCHRSAGHQGRDRTLSLMKKQFWWPSMSQALLRSIANCGRCIQYEAKGKLPPMQPIICTEPMELVHINYIRMEVTVATDKKPVVWNVLVVVDHFTRYVQAFVTKTIWRGQRPGYCTTITSLCLVFPNASCRIGQTSVGRSLQLCAACWG